MRRQFLSSIQLNLAVVLFNFFIFSIAFGDEKQSLLQARGFNGNKCYSHFGVLKCEKKRDQCNIEIFPQRNSSLFFKVQSEKFNNDILGIFTFKIVDIEKRLIKIISIKKTKAIDYEKHEEPQGLANETKCN